MIHPAHALIAAGVATLALIALFRPGRGPVARWRRLLNRNRRAHLEDALKHIYECHDARIPCTLGTLSGALALDRERSFRLADQLRETGLATLARSEYRLTAAGREYALRMLRLHRLWESYLAEETGVPESCWHPQADLREHLLSTAEAEAISRRLGHPCYDPHGEPIPTPEGELPPERGILLKAMAPGQFGRIIAFEDDPVTIYREIRESGLCLGMQVDTVAPSGDRLRFNADGRPRELSSDAAAHVRVEPVTADQAITTPPETLLSLRDEQAGTVLRITREIRGRKRRRLLDLGIVPGTPIHRVMESVAGNPIAFRIRGAVIALRREQAGAIIIRKNEEKAEEASCPST